MQFAQTLKVYSTWQLSVKTLFQLHIVGHDIALHRVLAPQIKQGDLIGGTIVSGTSIQVWYCTHAGRQPDRPIR